LNPKETVNKKVVSEVIEEIGRVQFVDEVAMSAMLTAILFRLVKRF